MPWLIAGPSIRGMRLTATASVISAVALAAAVAPAGAAAATVQKSNVKTFILPAGKTKTFEVGYPSALKFAGASYSCSAKVFGLGKRYVTILSRGSALGGTVCRVKARNSAQLPSLDTTASIRVTATTTYATGGPPPGLG